MTKREYYRAALNLARTDRQWLYRVLDGVRHGDSYIRPLHIALIMLALRNTA